jgi:hypothetical protein
VQRVVKWEQRAYPVFEAVIPAKAGIQLSFRVGHAGSWRSAFASVTTRQKLEPVPVDRPLL